MGRKNQDAGVRMAAWGRRTRTKQVDRVERKRRILDVSGDLKISPQKWFNWSSQKEGK